MNGSEWQRQLLRDEEAGLIDPTPSEWYGGDARDPLDECPHPVDPEKQRKVYEDEAGPFTVEDLDEAEERLNRWLDAA